MHDMFLSEASGWGSAFCFFNTREQLLLYSIRQSELYCAVTHILLILARGLERTPWRGINSAEITCPPGSWGYSRTIREFIPLQHD